MVPRALAAETFSAHVVGVMDGDTLQVSRRERALHPEKENATSWPVFWPEEMSCMEVPAKLNELHLRNTADSWADDAESRNGRRLPHNSG